MCSTLSGVVKDMTPADSACIGLIEVGEGGGGLKISLSNLINYFSVSGDSKQKKSHKTTQNYHFFDVAPKCALTTCICFFQPDSLSPFTMRLQGQIDAAVNGGFNKGDSWC